MMWLYDFSGFSWEELARLSSLAFMTAMLLISVFAVGAASEEWGPAPASAPARTPKKF
jgi:hypothetical protein